MTIDVTDPQTFVPIIGGVLIPFVVAWLTKLQSQLWVKSAVAVLSAALIALGVYLTDTEADTWEGALSAFLTALVAAAASRVTVTGGADTRLALNTEHFGVGRAEPTGDGL